MKSIREVEHHLTPLDIPGVTRYQETYWHSSDYIQPLKKEKRYASYTAKMNISPERAEAALAQLPLCAVRYETLSSREINMWALTRFCSKRPPLKVS